jgi:hypothetical protein
LDVGLGNGKFSGDFVRGSTDPLTHNPQIEFLGDEVSLLIIIVISECVIVGAFYQTKEVFF